uniref:Putative myocyte enhancer factor 2 n=1 Tax=Corethrella appendiculata TaxID=1370023 RepID=U5EYN0_9DIPT
MGRKKIQISRITDERNRQVTFNKRKFGVMKKAYELSVLCDCEIALIIFSSSNKLYQYASTDMDKVLLKYTEYNEPHESLTNKNIIEKENKNGTMSPDSPEPDDYTLTPRTEAKYNKIDEDFQIMIQRNQQLSGGRVNINNSNYTLPVSVPVIGTYNDSGMLQASPQMGHNSISPRPSSSETDSVYPTGSMLEMSNGYPHSASPLGSPSPGPSPGISGHNSSNNNTNNKLHLQTHRQHSPTNHTSRATNLRVVIPTPMNPNLSADEVTYTEHARQPTLNTPVIALQTSIPGLSNYPNLTTFGAQDFSMSGNDLNMIATWSTHQNTVNTLQHTSGLPHLSISNSTPPPPSTSPLSVKIKAEPISPPRDHHPHHHHNVISSGSNQITITSMSNVNHNNSSSSSSGSSSSLGSNLNHSHLLNSRPSSTGHLTPTPGSVTPTNTSSPSITVGHLPEYDSPINNSHKRPRISEGWNT